MDASLPTDRSPEARLKRFFQAALDSAQPGPAIAQALTRMPGSGPVVVLGAGKAALSMARAVEQILGDHVSGLVVARRGEGAAGLRWIEAAEADHPRPTAEGVQAARRLLQTAQRVTPGSRVLFLVSGGASSLLTVPSMGTPLEEVQALFDGLLASGAAIAEINTVRKAISLCAGGRLGVALSGSALLTLVLSDVPGDAPDMVGSGPTLGGDTTAADARAVLARHGLTPGAALARHLASAEAEPVQRGDPRLLGGSVHLLGSGQTGLDAAEALALKDEQCRKEGLKVLNLGDAIEGEARQAALVMAGLVRSVVRNGKPVGRPCLILSGGETTVTLGPGAGRGGRNSEFLLAFALATADLPGVYALAADTDGVDGSEENAGAVIGPEGLKRAAAMGLSPRQALDRHDAYTVFERLGGLVHTGPTGVNINDFRAILVL